MSVLKKIFSTGAKDLTDSIGNVLDDTLTSDDEKLKAKAQITSIVVDALFRLHSLQASIISKEADGNWLQRSWRPIVMLMFALVVVYAFFLQPAFFPQAINVRRDLPQDFWGLLKIGLGGFVMGRSIEKVAKTVTQNVDLPFLRKRDRKDKID